MLILMIPLLSFRVRNMVLFRLVITRVLCLYKNCWYRLYFMNEDIGKWILILIWIILILINLRCPPTLGMACILTLLALSLQLLFTVNSLVGFYIIFELCLLPVFGIILGWGGQPERLSAGLYMLFYTLCTSLPFIGWAFTSNVNFFIELIEWTTRVRLFILLPFIVKTPIYLLHIWLPKAHVEAPVRGSIGLAGVLLKVGRYGVWYMVQACSRLVILILAGLLITGRALARMITSSQIDLKALIAYSSVAHIGILTLALLISSHVLNLGALIIILAHGMSGRGLFYWGRVIYERTNTRSLMLVRGMSEIIPVSTLIWIILILINLRCPPTLGIWAEILIIPGLITFSWWRRIRLFILMIGVVLYSLSLYFIIRHGEAGWRAGEEANIKELIVGFMHLISAWSAPWLLWLLE